MGVPLVECGAKTQGNSLKQWAAALITEAAPKTASSSYPEEKCVCVRIGWLGGKEEIKGCISPAGQQVSLLLSSSRHRCFSACVRVFEGGRSRPNPG